MSERHDIVCVYAHTYMYFIYTLTMSDLSHFHVGVARAANRWQVRSLGFTL